MGKKKEERKLILVGGWQGRCVPATCVRVGATVWLACLQRVAWWQDQGGAGCSGNRQLCRDRGDVVRVAANPRLSTTGSVSCVGDRAMWWQIHLRAMSDVVVSKWGWPSCTQGEEMAVML